MVLWCDLAGDGKDAGGVINHGCDDPGEDDDNTAKVGSEKMQDFEGIRNQRHL